MLFIWPFCSEIHSRFPQKNIKHITFVFNVDDNNSFLSSKSANLIDHVTLKTRVLMLQIQLFIKEYITFKNIFSWTPVSLTCVINYSSTSLPLHVRSRTLSHSFTALPCLNKCRGSGVVHHYFFKLPHGPAVISLSYQAQQLSKLLI